MYRRKDHFYRRAQSEGFRSRAAYKLQELSRRYRLLRRGDRVLDLGAWPGGWLQVAAERVGESGRVVGVDTRPVKPPAATVCCIEADVLDPGTTAALAERFGAMDVVLSDMAPKLTGVRATDDARCAALVEAAVAVADRTLRPGGRFMVKIFMNEDLKRHERALRERFAEVRLTRPASSRTPSAEMYVIARGYRGAPGAR